MKLQKYGSPKPIRSAFVAVLVSLLLAACGGGSGSGNGDDNGMMPSSDGDTGGNTTQTIPSTFSEGSIAPVYAQSAADTVDSMQGTPFRTLTTGMKRIWEDDGGSISLLNRSSPYVSSITDHANGGATMVFVVDGQEHEIEFPPEKVNAGYSDEDLVVVGDREFYIDPSTLSTDNNPLNEDYYSFGYWGYEDDEPGHYEGEVVYGARTGAGLPMGTVSYTGNFFGRLFPADGDPTWRVARRGVWGKIGLEADLDNLTVSGEVNGLWVQETQENGNQWSELPDTTSIAISEGNIAGGRFVTTWEGRDTDPTNPAETSPRGFAGDIVGDFYGPNAEEAAGVFSGQRDATDTTPEQVVWGIFGAEKDE